LTEIANPPRRFEPLLPAPTAKELIEEVLAAANLSESSAERMSLLTSALSGIDREAANVPADWRVAVKVAATAAIERDLAVDRAYVSLRDHMLGLATARARTANVRGVQRVLAQIQEKDAALGGLRPDNVSALVAAVQDQLDAARRLQLERDRWALRLPELRQYRALMTAPFQRLVQLEPALDDIKALAGSDPAAIGAILRAADRIQKTAAGVVPPDEFRDLHSLLVSAAQLAERAAKLRREAALTNDIDRAWNASSAAAGALMLSGRARADMRTAFRLPQLPR
jgi:hypothetical protein